MTLADEEVDLGGESLGAIQALATQAKKDMGKAQRMLNKLLRSQVTFLQSLDDIEKINEAHRVLQESCEAALKKLLSLTMGDEEACDSQSTLATLFSELLDGITCEKEKLSYYHSEQDIM